MSGVNLPRLSSAGPRRRTFNRVHTARLGSLFRSEDMVLLRLYFSRAAAYDTIDELGELGLCEFRDLNQHQSAFQRTFSENVRRCDDMMRVIRFLAEQVAAVDKLVLMPSGGPENAANIRLDDLDSHLRSLENSLLEMNANADALQTQYNEIVELRQVLEKASEFFHTAPTTETALEKAMKDANAARNMNSSIMSGFFDGMSALSASPTIVVSGDRTMSDHMHGEVNNSANMSNLLSFFTGTIGRDRIATLNVCCSGPHMVIALFDLPT